MNSVERTKQVCKKRKIPISKLESELEFSNGYIGQLKKGVFPEDRLYKVAKHLNLSTDYLTGKTEDSVCGECGFHHDTIDDTAEKAHDYYHKNWESMLERYGFRFTRSEFEEFSYEAEKYVRYYAWSGTEVDYKYYDMFFKSEFWKYAEQNRFEVNIKYDDFLLDIFSSHKYPANHKKP